MPDIACKDVVSNRTYADTLATPKTFSARLALSQRETLSNRL